MRDRPCPEARGKAGQRTFMVYAYIFKSCADNGYYIGICKNIKSRLAKHNKGGVRSTKSRKPFTLIYSEEFESYTRARAREKEIKSYKGGNTFKDLISHCGIV